MSLTVKDFQEIRSIIREEVRKEVREEVHTALETAIETKIKPFVREEIESLALSCKLGFDDMDRQFAEIRTELKLIRDIVRTHSADITELKVAYSNVAQARVA